MMEQAPDEELLVDVTNTSACQEIPEIKKKKHLLFVRREQFNHTNIGKHVCCKPHKLAHTAERSLSMSLDPRGRHGALHILGRHSDEGFQVRVELRF